MTLDGLLHQVSSKKAILAARRGALAAAKKEVRAGSSRCAPLPCMHTLTTAPLPKRLEMRPSALHAHAHHGAPSQTARDAPFCLACTRSPRHPFPNGSRCVPLPCMQTLTTARSPSPQARAGSSPVATPPHVPVSAPNVPVSAPHMPSAPVVAAPLDRLAAKKAVLAAKRESKRDVHASAKHEVADTELHHNATPQPPLKLLAG